ncbi:MAG: hypothetical protein LBT44_00465 [Clostridiales bacterium]|nr:hypothetical protein [Clostridiales bacterium]
MEIGEGAGLKSLSVDDNGKPVPNPLNFAQPLDPRANIDDVTTWTPHIPKIGGVPDECDSAADFHHYWTWIMGGEKNYYPVLEELRADQDYIDNSGEETIAASSVNVSGVSSKSTPRALVLTMEKWLNMGSPVGDYWVIDRDGWSYWASPIQNGDATGLLVSGVTARNVPEDTYFYGVNVVAQMATRTGLIVNGQEDNYERFSDPENGGWTADAEDLVRQIADGRPVMSTATTTEPIPADVTIKCDDDDVIYKTMIHPEPGREYILYTESPAIWTYPLDADPNDLVFEPIDDMHLKIIVSPQASEESPYYKVSTESKSDSSQKDSKTIMIM